MPVPEDAQTDAERGARAGPIQGHTLETRRPIGALQCFLLHPKLYYPVLVRLRLGHSLKIHLEGSERIWCVRSRPLSFSHNEVLSAVAGRPEQSWSDLRIPGVAVPGVIKAGTYLAPRGREFWYVTRKHFDCALTIRLDHSRYRAVVLGIAEPESWAQRITDWVHGQGEFAKATTSSWLPWAPSSFRS